jgi:hypothetical protein
MLYTLLTVAFVTLLLTFVTSYMILQVVIPEKPFRRLLLLFVVMTPFIALFAVAKALFSRPKLIRYSADLGKIEDEIESERSRTFGERIVHPSFSQRWRLSYLDAVERSALAAAKLDPSFGPSVCGISQLR